MVRSLENLPEPATLMIAFVGPGIPIRVKRTERVILRLQIGSQVGQMHVVVAVGQQQYRQRREDASARSG